ncbi:hypothetical protein J5N97_005757 [Dioscorea zingiberensis]|uniref:Uncharacterized protein n=1 Tax=Dioscorea zingiberensis TaxID=325984 RepID=A0A9D5D920_9LILI|nr:hypothetical protein J5N97_005757 [Dioscorea zingiberensis]
MEKGFDRIAATETAVAIKKDRHIVSWSPEEDELLRQQVSIHGDDGWTSIAAKFKDKTSRQCRRRWYTYLNTECKKGGWSVEEDMILCEAQRIFGNRWTEIAKVVSGRTDNAVKNRFSTLCKKRAKLEASKENNGSSTSTNNKRLMVHKGLAMVVESSAPSKQDGYPTSDHTENSSIKQQVLRGLETRPPLAEIVQNYDKVCNLPYSDKSKANEEVSNNKNQGSFLKRDDPKISALLQQAELLSSLAVKVNSQNTKQSLEDAWKELQDYLLQTEDSDLLRSKISGMDFLLDDFKDLIEDLRSENSGGQPSKRKPDQCETSLVTSECSTESTKHSNAVANENLHQHDECSSKHAAMAVRLQHQDASGQTLSTDRAAIAKTSTEPLNEKCENISALPGSEFASPIRMVPPFNSFSEGIPTPKFSTSERNFLLNLLSMPSPAPSPNSSKTPWWPSPSPSPPLSNPRKSLNKGDKKGKGGAI